MSFLKKLLSTQRKVSKAATAAHKLASAVQARSDALQARPKHGASNGKSYPVGIVGERSYQSQIKTLREGQPVQLWHEPGNPYDDRAVAVATFAGETIGYLARDFWLRDALLDEQKPCSARVLRLAKNGKMTGVVIEVTLSGSPIGERDFKAQ